jgi:hypothetical protein
MALADRNSETNGVVMVLGADTLWILLLRGAYQVILGAMVYIIRYGTEIIAFREKFLIDVFNFFILIRY